MDVNSAADQANQEGQEEEPASTSGRPCGGGPVAVVSYTRPSAFRHDVRRGIFNGPTNNNICPGYLQCNLVVLPTSSLAFDFLLFCQRNPQACPLLEVCCDDDDDDDEPEEQEELPSSAVPSDFDHTTNGRLAALGLVEDPGETTTRSSTATAAASSRTRSFRSRTLASGVDLRTDLPKYAIYRDGVLSEQVTDCTDYWPDPAVAFLIGCSFSYDAELQRAGIPLRSAEEGRNVPMYRTNIPCTPAGSLSGHLVVSMKPIPSTRVTQHVAITSRYLHAHGGPVCVGNAAAIGIHDLSQPDWGDPIDIKPDEVPVFHACGVTPQAVLMHSRVPFAITHAAGHMLVTDRRADLLDNSMSSS